MALRLGENENINGINVKIYDKTHIIKISQLADGITLFVSSKTDIALAMNKGNNKITEHRAILQRERQNS